MEIEMLDDWKGVIDPKTRRTLQNRLNQRAHRHRLRAGKTVNTPTRQAEGHADPAQEAPVENAVVKQLPQRIEFADLDTVLVLGPQAETSRVVLRKLEALLHAEFVAGSPRTDLLLGLTRVNFLRALYANIDVLGYSATEMHDDALSQFGTYGPAKSTLRDPALLPVALQPTPTQAEVPHHPWLDLLPIAQMRENLILAGESYDDTKLCRDLSGHGIQFVPRNRAASARGETGVIIWRDPWDPSGWEVTETFLRSWGWAVRDCWDLFRSTNRWRRIRGEPPLFRISE